MLVFRSVTGLATEVIELTAVWTAVAKELALSCEVMALWKPKGEEAEGTLC